METLRLFIAADLPADLKAQLAGLQKRLSAGGVGDVRWVNPGAIHLTLKFLGSVETERVAGITNILADVSARTGSFELSLGGVGAFPALSRPRVIWVGLGGETGRLKKLAEEIDRELAGAGFSREKRAYEPHLTLARIKYQPGSAPASLAGAVAGTRGLTPAFFKVGSINLMKSDLSPAGARYTRLHSAKFKL